MNVRPEQDIFEETIHRIVKAFSASTGEIFFRTLVKQLATVLDADYAFIGQVINEVTKVKTLAFFSQGKLSNNIDYDLAGTPSDIVAKGQVCVFPDHVCQHFPDDYLLGNMAAQGYFGIPLYNTVGEVQGILALIYRRPVSNTTFTESVLSLFASRTAAELERKKREDLTCQNESRLSALLDLCFRSSEMNEEEIIHFGVEEAVRLTCSKIGYFHMVAEDEREIRLVSWSEETLRNCNAIYPNHYPLDHAGIWADCARMRKPVIHNDFQQEPHRQGYPDGHSHVTRHASIPVIDTGKIVAILGVGNKTDPYDETDTRHLSLIGQEIWKIVLRRRYEKDLLEARAKAEKSELLKDSILSALSSELLGTAKAVLKHSAAIRNSLNGKITPEEKRMFKDLETNCNKLNQTIRELISIPHDRETEA